MKTYIFGDIEGKENLYYNTIDCISNNINNNNRFIFLGDIYNFKNSDESINMIHTITSFFFNEENVITEDMEPIELIHTYRKLWREKNLKACQTEYKQYWRTKPRNNLPNNISSSNHIFILGNKEVEFVGDIVNSKLITKLSTKEGYVFSVLVEYYDTQKNKNERLIRTYTPSQLNTMYNYISNCYNYYIEDGVLYTHCYFNNVKFDNVNVVVSGHNKAYGKFRDERYNGLTIYIIDLTFSYSRQLKNYVIRNEEDDSFQLMNKEIRPKHLISISSYV